MVKDIYNPNKKSYLQKMYEKFVMLYFSVMKSSYKANGSDLGKFAKFEGVLSVMLGEDMYGENHLYLVLTGKDLCIPLARFMGENECKSIEPDFDTDRELTKMFYSLMGKESRFTITDFNEKHKIKVLDDFSIKYDKKS